jgi:hypothetical protein
VIYQGSSAGQFHNSITVAKVPVPPTRLSINR